MFTFSYRFRNLDDGFVWVFTCFYGPLSREDRTLLWEELGPLKVCGRTLGGCVLGGGGGGLVF